MLGRKRRRAGGRGRPPAPYFRFAQFLAVREIHVLLTHGQMVDFYEPTWPITATGYNPDYVFSQNHTIMQTQNTNGGGPSLIMTGGDPRHNFGACALMSLSYYPYVVLNTVFQMFGSSVGPAGSSTIPPVVQQVDHNVGSMCYLYNFVRVVHTDWSWQAEYQTDQLKHEYDEAPIETVFAVQPRHRRFSCTWFREMPRTPDPLTASGLLPLLYFDGVTSTAPLEDSMIRPWMEFNNLLRYGHKFGIRGRVRTYPWCGFRVNADYGLVGPTIQTAPVSTFGDHVTVDPGPRNHPGLSTTVIRRYPTIDNAQGDMRVMLGGGFLYFFVPGMKATTHTVIQSAAVTTAASETVIPVRAIPPCVTFLKRTTRFKFWSPKPIMPSEQPFLSPRGQLAGNSRIVSLRTARQPGFQHFTPGGPPVLSAVAFTDVDGHAPMG